MSTLAALFALMFAAPTPCPGSAGFQPAAVSQPSPFTEWATQAVANPNLDSWKRSLLHESLARTDLTTETATVTSYCSQCQGWPVPETSTEPGLHPSCAAADPRHWAIAPHRQRKAVIWVDLPPGWGGPRLITINDTGGAVKGRDRFDLCQGITHRCTCDQWGRRPVRYIALRGSR